MSAKLAGQRFFETKKAGKNPAKISQPPDIDNSRIRGRFIERRFNRNETSLLEILKGLDEILGDFNRLKFAHALHEKFTLMLWQCFDFFDDLLCGHVFR